MSTTVTGPLGFPHRHMLAYLAAPCRPDGSIVRNGRPATPGLLSQGPGRMDPMESTSLRFAEAARALGDAARPRGWALPAFRSPPRIPGDRSIRRRSDGGATVAVRYRGRPWPAVLADMIEGVVVANEAAGVVADKVRTELWRTVEACGLIGVGEVPPAPPALVVSRSEPEEPDRPTTVKRLARVA